MTKATEEPEGPDAARAAVIAAAVIGSLFSLVALIMFSGRTAISVAVGSLIAVANLVALAAIIRNVLRAPLPEEDASEDVESPEKQPDPVDRGAAREAGKRGGAAWGVFALLKMLLLFGGVWILLTRGLVDPIPLVVGYGVLPLGITIGGLSSSIFPARFPARRRKR